MLLEVIFPSRPSVLIIKGNYTINMHSCIMAQMVASPSFVHPVLVVTNTSYLCNTSLVWLWVPIGLSTSSSYHSLEQQNCFYGVWDYLLSYVTINCIYFFSHLLHKKENPRNKCHPYFPRFQELSSVHLIWISYLVSYFFYWYRK